MEALLTLLLIQLNILVLIVLAVVARLMLTRGALVTLGVILAAGFTLRFLIH